MDHGTVRKEFRLSFMNQTFPYRLCGLCCQLLVQVRDYTHVRGQEDECAESFSQSRRGHRGTCLKGILIITKASFPCIEDKFALFEPHVRHSAPGPT